MIEHNMHSYSQLRGGRIVCTGLCAGDAPHFPPLGIGHRITLSLTYPKWGLDIHGEFSAMRVFVIVQLCSYQTCTVIITQIGANSTMVCHAHCLNTWLECRLWCHQASIGDHCFRAHKNTGVQDIHKKPLNTVAEAMAWNTNAHFSGQHSLCNTLWRFHTLLGVKTCSGCQKVMHINSHEPKWYFGRVCCMRAAKCRTFLLLSMSIAWNAFLLLP